MTYVSVPRGLRDSQHCSFWGSGTRDSLNVQLECTDVQWRPLMCRMEPGGEEKARGMRLFLSILSPVSILFRGELFGDNSKIKSGPVWRYILQENKNIFHLTVYYFSLSWEPRQSAGFISRGVSHGQIERQAGSKVDGAENRYFPILNQACGPCKEIRAFHWEKPVFRSIRVKNEVLSYLKIMASETNVLLK